MLKYELSVPGFLRQRAVRVVIGERGGDEKALVRSEFVVEVDFVVYERAHDVHVVPLHNRIRLSVKEHGSHDHDYAGQTETHVALLDSVRVV